MSNPQTLLTLPLSKFLDSHLGRGTFYENGVPIKDVKWSSRPIDRDLATIIEHLPNSSSLCHIQWPDAISPHLTEPLLWDISSWNSQCDRWIRENLAAEARRKERFILEANIKIVSKAYAEWSGIPLESAKVTAYKTMLSKKKEVFCQMIGCADKLITKEEEL